jgi:hypothetical protein
MATPTLEDIRFKYESLAKENAISTSKNYLGYPTRAYKTGTLYKSIRVLLTSKEAGKVVFDLAAVRYGVFLNYGFTHYGSKKFIRRPFAAAAADDKELKQLIDDYTKDIISEIVLEQLEIIKPKLEKYGLGPKISPNSSTKRYTYK